MRTKAKRRTSMNPITVSLRCIRRAIPEGKIMDYETEQSPSEPITDYASRRGE